MSTALVIVVAAAISGISGYVISSKFFRSDYSVTNKSGDFGTARGGFFALMSGCLIGMVLTSLASHVVAFDAGVAFITSMVVGAVAGVVGMFRGGNARKSKPGN